MQSLLMLEQVDLIEPGFDDFGHPVVPHVLPDGEKLVSWARVLLGLPVPGA